MGLIIKPSWPRRSLAPASHYTSVPLTGDQHGLVVCPCAQDSFNNFLNRKIETSEDSVRADQTISRKTMQKMNQPTLYNIVEDIVIFQTDKDINEHLKNSITAKKNEEGKIKDYYQLPYAILAIRNMLTDIPSEFAIDEILENAGVQNCPPYLRDCINHSIRQVISPEILGLRNRGDELSRLFKCKNRFMKPTPEIIADAYSELTRRAIKGGKTVEREKNDISHEWYIEHIPSLSVFTPFLCYDSANISKAFLYGQFPTGNEFYDQDASDVSDLLRDLEAKGQIVPIKATDTEMMAHDNDDHEGVMYNNNKSKRDGYNGIKYVDWMPNNRVICGICRKAGHIGARCPQRHHHPEYSKHLLFNSKLVEFFEDNQYNEAQNYHAVGERKSKQ